MMFRRGRHRAPKHCTDHLAKIAEQEKDLKWYQQCHERFVDDINALKDQIHRLQTELGSEDPTEPIPVHQLRNQLRQHIPHSVKVVTENGSMMLLPVGHTRTRRVRPAPSWALRE
jgi:hypothetical protein